MSNVKKQKELDKREKHIRRLYGLIWMLACPLVYILVKLMGFQQVNIVYWTLLVVPVLLAAYNMHQVPKVKGKPVVAQQAADADNEQPEQEPQQDEEGVTHIQHVRMMMQALQFPAVVATPLLLTVVVDLFIQLAK